ncbi:hypothetical protein Tco_1331178, partial [Tanacetum coccineum]
AELRTPNDNVSKLGSRENTFMKGSLSIGAKGLSSLKVDSATTPSKLGDCNAEDDGE